MEGVMEKLKPCPFCGHVPEIHGTSNETGFCNFYSVRCMNPKCSASCVSVLDKTKAKVVRRWNMRVVSNGDDIEF